MMRLVHALPVDTEREELLRIAAAAESASEHPLARAIAGLGIEALVDEHAVVVGRPAFLGQWSISLGDKECAWRLEREDAAETVVAVAWDGALRGPSLSLAP